MSNVAQENAPLLNAIGLKKYYSVKKGMFAKTQQVKALDGVSFSLERGKTLAVVGLSDREETTSNRVTKEMQARGYKIIPVNPKAAGGEILGEKAYASLAEIPFPVDIVNVYRRSEFLPDVARDFLKADAKIFWAQLGLESLEAEEILRAGGCDDIVMNRCIKREHTRLIEEA